MIQLVYDRPFINCKDNCGSKASSDQDIVQHGLIHIHSVSGWVPPALQFSWWHQTCFIFIFSCIHRVYKIIRPLGCSFKESNGFWNLYRAQIMREVTELYESLNVTFPGFLQWNIGEIWSILRLIWQILAVHCGLSLCHGLLKFIGELEPVYAAENATRSVDVKSRDGERMMPAPIFGYLIRNIALSCDLCYAQIGRHNQWFGLSCFVSSLCFSVHLHFRNSLNERGCFQLSRIPHIPVIYVCIVHQRSSCEPWQLWRKRSVSQQRCSSAYDGAEMYVRHCRFELNKTLCNGTW